MSVLHIAGKVTGWPACVQSAAWDPMRISSLARSVAVFGTTTVTGTPNLRRA